MEWRFYYEDGTDSGWHKNPQTYLEFAEKIHRYFTSIANNNPDLADFTQYQDWQQLAPKVSSILNKPGKKQQRIKAWQEAAKVDGFFISPETIPQYRDWNEGFQNLSLGNSQDAMKHPIYGFYQAASYHRWYVLRDLLPKHGLMVA